jgi:hypothetical protein
LTESFFFLSNYPKKDEINQEKQGYFFVCFNSNVGGDFASLQLFDVSARIELMLIQT